MISLLFIKCSPLYAFRGDAHQLAADVWDIQENNRINELRNPITADVLV
jgi:hypothetical protein